MNSRQLPTAACFLFIASTQLVGASYSADLLTKTTPFRSPKGEYVTEMDRYHTFRIPGMVVAADGSILLFAEGRRGDGSDPRRDKNAPIDIVMRRSTDHGKTWEPMVTIATGLQRDGKTVDFGDPTPVLDVATRTVHLLYGQWPDEGPIYPVPGQSPTPSAANQIVWVRSSQDHGKTWSDARQIVYPDEPTETADGLVWHYAEPGPGNGIQLKWQRDASRNGRLVVPAKRAGSAGTGDSVTVEPFVFYSDDHGQSWQVGNVTSGPDANESEVVELTNGELLLDARQNSGDFRRRHRSSDGGVTWGPNRSDNIALPKVDGSLARFSSRRTGQDRNRLLFSCARGTNGLNRNAITVWLSDDEGQSFERPVSFNEGFAAYSVIGALFDGSIGMVAETAGTGGTTYGAITFYRFALEVLETDAIEVR